jgi:hypothetical protein
MRLSRSLAALALLVGASAAPPLAAQDNIPWRLSYFPYLTASPNDGVMGIARAIWFQQAGWGERVTLHEYVAVEAGYSTRDAWVARGTFGSPRFADGWRIMARGEVSHLPNFGDPESGLARDLALGWIDVTRRVQGPLHAAVRLGARQDRFELAGQPETSALDLSARGALVLDLRDREYEVNRGVLAEVGAIVGSGGGDGRGYGAPYAHVRGYSHPILPLRLTGRLGWRGTTSSDALAPAYEFPGWEGAFTTLGGHLSHRGLPVGALTGDGTIFAGLEARFDVLNVGELGAVTLMAFVDGGKPLFAERVGGGTPAADWIWAPGGGIAIRALRAATLTITAARANGDTRWYVGSGWSW